jgi:lipopolysaccharide/colanic/teichoic acid biosynthesis glycosyltransferase
MKRLFDILVSGTILLLLSPLLALVTFLVWNVDRRTPFYVASRVGRGGRPYRMIKYRSMYLGAHRTGVMSTAADDPRITPIGAFLRRYKLDELPQLLNVLKGEMSLVGPRPNVPPEVALYSDEERHLLDARPGITDIASIVFSDEGDILRGSQDANRDYNLLIRPWKSRLGLHYVRHASVWLDLRLLWWTAVALIDRAPALVGLSRMLEKSGADAELVQIARRAQPLTPTRPPGVRPEDWERHLTYGTA